MFMFMFMFMCIIVRHMRGEFREFGSCENGFWINGSDVDACMVLRNCTTKQACLSKLTYTKALVQREKLARVSIINASVPIAKYIFIFYKSTFRNRIHSSCPS